MALEFLSKALAGFRGSTRVAPMQTAGVQSEEGLYGDGYVVNRIDRTPALRGRQKYITYNQLVADTLIVAASVRYFLTLLASAEWTVQPPVDDKGEPLPGAQDVADFVEDCMGDMESSWRKLIRRAARYRFLGFSIQEWTAKKRDDGCIGFLDVEPRPNSTIERWDLDEGGSVQGVTQYITGRPEAYLPRGKIIYMVDDTLEDGPEGVGLLRHVHRAAERLKAYEDLEELAFETDLRGIPIGRAPLKEMREAHAKGEGSPGFMTVDAVRKARQAVDNFVKNKLLNRQKGAVLDSETYEGKTPDGGTSPSSTRKWDVELLKGEGGPHEAAAQAIVRINKEIATLLGTEHVLLGQDGRGSLALGTAKMDNFFLVVTSTLAEIAEALDRDYVAVLCGLNGIDKTLWPKLEPQDIEINDVLVLAQALQALATAGAPLHPDDPAVDKVRARAGLPPAPPPPELDPADQALLDRMRAGLPINLNPQDPNAPPGDGTGGGGGPAAPGGAPPKGKQADVKPGSEGAAAQRVVSKLLKSLLQHDRRSST